MRRGNHGLLGSGASSVALGRGLFPKAVQMWRVLDPSVSRDSHHAQPWAGRQVPQLSMRIRVCLIYFAPKHWTPGFWFSSTTRSPVALELGRSRYMTAACGEGISTVALEVLQQTPPSTGQIWPVSAQDTSVSNWGAWSNVERLERFKGLRPSLTASLLILSLFARDYIPRTALILWSSLEVRLSQTVASSTFGASGCIYESRWEAK